MEYLSGRVRDFIRSTETLLSPVSTGPLSDEERDLIVYYANMVISQLAQPQDFSARTGHSAKSSLGKS
jgi:hypothetical protein